MSDRFSTSTSGEPGDGSRRDFIKVARAGALATAAAAQRAKDSGVRADRDMRNGRNFEYYSEDSLLSTVLAAEAVNGTKGEGVNSHRGRRPHLNASRIDAHYHILFEGIPQTITMTADIGYVYFDVPRDIAAPLSHAERVGAAAIADGVPEVLLRTREQLMHLSPPIS